MDDLAKGLEIKTIAATGELIYYLKDNRVHSASVLGIEINVKENFSRIKYHTCHTGSQGILEEYVFVSKEKLVHKLLEGVV